MGVPGLGHRRSFGGSPPQTSPPRFPVAALCQRHRRSQTAATTPRHLCPRLRPSEKSFAHLNLAGDDARDPSGHRKDDSGARAGHSDDEKRLRARGKMSQGRGKISRCRGHPQKCGDFAVCAGAGHSGLVGRTATGGNAGSARKNSWNRTGSNLNCRDEPLGNQKISRIGNFSGRPAGANASCRRL